MSMFAEQIVSDPVSEYETLHTRLDAQTPE
jgi:hypothetical protein